MGNKNRLKNSFWGCLSGFGIVGDIWRGWIVPVGGSTPDRLKAQGRRRTGNMNRCLSGFGSIWRGWIVPVGGSTPDRLKLGPARVEGIFYKKDGAKVGNVI